MLACGAGQERTLDSIFTKLTDPTAPQQTLWMPTSAAIGPWGDTLHGGSTAALLAAVLEAANPSSLPLARLSLDMYRPVPQSPLRVTTVERRVGRRLALLDAELLDGDRSLGRASALFAEEQSATASALPPCPLAAADDIEEISLAESARREAGRKLGTGDGLHARMLMQQLAGGHGSGHSDAWIRIPLELAPGVPLTPIAHLAGCADFANGIAQRIAEQPGGSRVGYINADISLHVLRQPTTHRIGMTARNEASAVGRGIVSAECWDEDGLLGRLTQTALANPLIDS